MFDTILKKHNCEVFISDISTTECPLDINASYTKSVRESGYTIRTLKNNRLGSSSSNIFDTESIKKTLKNSLDSAGHSNKLPKGFSFTGTEGSTKVRKCHDKNISKNPETIASDLREICAKRALEANVNLTNGKIRLTEFEYTITNSLGIEKKEKGTYILAMIDSKADTKKQVSELTSTYIRRIYDKSDFLDWFDKTLKTTARFIEPSKLKSGTYDIILNPGVIGPLLTDTIGYWSSAKSRIDGISLFEGKENTTVAAETFSATDDPAYPDAPSTFGIDMEAQKTKKTDIIKDGIFSNYFYDNRYSSYFNTKSTGNSKKAAYTGPEYIYNSSGFCGPNNLVIKEGKEHLSSMLKDFTGVFIEAVGIPSADRETGNFGFELRNAFLVEKGEMRPVRYGIYSGRVQDIIKSVSWLSKEREISADRMAPEFNSACISPYFLLKDQKISGE
ncbi:MAG: TldD/PmbA family protein [archaeon]